jgi:glucose/arabinose dehydrogenase
MGKILRIIPDLKEHVDASTVRENGRYRIARDNPFASKSGARKEIWAYGLRNPHRLTWDVDPADRSNNHLITQVIGLRTWETGDIIHKGANYGFHAGRTAATHELRIGRKGEVYGRRRLPGSHTMSGGRQSICQASEVWPEAVPTYVS